MKELQMPAQPSSVKQYPVPPIAKYKGINTNLKKVPKIRSSNRWYKDPQKRKALYVLCASLLCVLIIIAAIAVPLALTIVLTTTTAITTTQASTSGTVTTNASTNVTVTTNASTTLVTANALNLTDTTTTTSTTTTVCPNMTCTFSATAAPMTSTYGVEHLNISCTQTLSAMYIALVVQRTVNATYANQYQTFWNLTTNQTYTQTNSQIIYTWTLLNGQIIDGTGFPYFVEGQYSLYNVNQTTSLDTYFASFVSICGHAVSQNGTF